MVVLRRGASILAQRRWRVGLSVSTELLAAIDALLAEAHVSVTALDRVDVSAGASQRTSRLRASAVIGALLVYAAGADVMELQKPNYAR